MGVMPVPAASMMTLEYTPEMYVHSPKGPDMGRVSPSVIYEMYSERLPVLYVFINKSKDPKM